MICSLRPWAPRSRALLLGGLLALLLPAPDARAAAPVAGGWTVRVRGLDLTRQADPVLAGGELLVDAAALAPSLRLRVEVRGREARILDPAGVEWSGAAGDPLLTAPGRRLTLGPGLRVEGRSVYLPVAALAELAGLGLQLDPTARIAVLGEAAAPRSSGAGWQAFTRPKPAAPGGIRAAPPRPAWDLRLPPAHDTLRVDLGVGTVPGVDWGGDLTATGSLWGYETGISALLAAGPEGAGVRSGHARLANPGRGWEAEAGDLFSEVWGFARGARFRFPGRAVGDPSGPALSLYLEDDRAGYRGTVAAFGHELRLGEHARLGGELASDGSWVTNARLERHRFRLFGHHREASGRFEQRGSGLSGSFDLPRRLSLEASVARGSSEGRPLDSRSLALRLPLGSGGDLRLETTRWDFGGVHGRTGGLSASRAFGGLLLRSRYQRREVDGAGLPFGPPLRLLQDELLTAASWHAPSRLRLDLELLQRWPDGREREDLVQAGASWRFSRRTSLQCFAALGASSLRDVFRLRLDHELRRGLSLMAEYGDVASFQGTSAGAAESPSRFRLMVRRTWDVATPGAASAVEGVVGAGALPQGGVPVELGPYRTLSDASGRYAFANVPPGRYDLRVPAEGVPAAYTAAPPAAVEMKRRESRRVDIPLVPLGEVRGWVYVDRDGDGRRGEEEGAAGIPLVLDGKATSSNEDGSFGFFNLPPGTYTLRLAAGHLPAALEAGLPAEIGIGLPPGGSVDHLELRLRERKKAVVFQAALPGRGR